MTEAVLFWANELNHDDVAVRVNSIYRLKIVITLMDNEQINHQIIPKLEGIIKSSDDEVLFAFARELATLFFLLPKFQATLIDFLSRLCQMEETVIREQAVNSLEVISAKMNPAEIQEHIVPLVYKVLILSSLLTVNSILRIESSVLNYYWSCITNLHQKKEN